MSEQRRKILIYFLVLNISIIAFSIAFVLAFDPKTIIEKDYHSTCVFQKVLGIYCPGCGGTRAVGYLFSFDILKSFLFYPPLFVGIFLVFYIDFLFIFSFIKNTLFYIQKHKFYEFISIPIAIILVFSIRNILLFFGIDYLGDFTK